MGNKLKILAFAGSLRQQSFNKRVLKAAIIGAKKAGAEVTAIDLIDFPMPIYNADDQEKNGFSRQTLKLQELLSRHNGLLIATPSYNGSLPAALKNVIDWASRPNELYQKEDIFPGKVAAIMSASPGSLGGVRALGHLRDVLTSVKVQVLPTEVAVPFVNDYFDGDETEMLNSQIIHALESLGASVVEMLRKIHNEPGLMYGSHNDAHQTQRAVENE